MDSVVKAYAVKTQSIVSSARNTDAQSSRGAAAAVAVAEAETLLSTRLLACRFLFGGLY
jgi:hypothetical protein